MDDTEDRERERELLTRILQYDTQDAIACYEAEMGVSVSTLRLAVEDSGECTMHVEARLGKPHKEVPEPMPRIRVAGFGR